MKKSNFYYIILIIPLLICCPNEINNLGKKVKLEVGTYNYLLVCINNKSNLIYCDFLFENNKFFIQNEVLKKTLIFDLNSNQKSIKKIEIKLKNEKDSLIINSNILLDTIYLTETKKYYIFKMINFWCYYDNLLDVNYIVEAERGIIGFYITDTTNNELYLYVRKFGNCLEKIIDYSVYKRFDLL